MYTADELEIRAALAGSPRADELISCLEGEIAKRDEELAACRVAVENCEVFRARIVELEARIVWLECEAQVNATPVSEAKAQGVVMPDVNLAAKALCNRHATICGIDADDQWKEYSQDFIEDAETVLANARLNATPVQQVSVPDISRLLEALERVATLHIIPPYTTPQSSQLMMLKGIADQALESYRAAAPAAPAADAGLVEALELAANRLDRLALEHDEFWRGYATAWADEARATANGVKS